MRPLYLTKEKIGDKQFKITLSDKYKSKVNPKEESTAFELTLDHGKLKKIDVAYNGVKKMSMDFFKGPMGEAMNYHLLDEGLDLSEQLRLGIVRYLQPGLHYLARIVDDYTYPKIYHSYPDGAGVCMFYDPYDSKHPLMIGLSNPGLREEDSRHAFFTFADDGLCIVRPQDRSDILNVKVEEAKKDQKPEVQKQDTLKMKKMAIFSELDRLTPSQQRDVLDTVEAKLALYRKPYGKE
ncbi:MAG: hypothetical protein II938_04225 [Alphaproteobacteria bacterium]|nr:hypothetical protein [Alphaproteobacteria bacterium]